MKKLFSALLIFSLVLCLFCPAASADGGLHDLSDAELTELYEAVRAEMLRRGLSGAGELTLREGKFIIGQDILPGTYTLKCTETSGETYGDMYSSLGGLLDDEMSGLMGSLGGMMGEVIRAQVEILGDYGTVLKSFELKTGDSVRITLEAGTALQIRDGTCTLTAD